MKCSSIYNQIESKEALLCESFEELCKDCASMHGLCLQAIEIQPSIQEYVHIDS
jgi:hypothetical protein